jgi:serine/threonine protein kinase
VSSSSSLPSRSQGFSSTAPLDDAGGGTTVLEGNVIAGKYLVGQVLGTGGMGRVFSAVHLSLDEPVALKVLHGQHSRNASAVSRFLREARATAKLRSDHVVRTLDYGTLESGEPCLVMEFVAGRDLRQVIRDRGPLPVAEALEYVRQACRGLEAAHAQRIVHRDLKPSNLLLTSAAGGAPLLKILDFGIAKALDSSAARVGEETLTAATELLGSPAYMSPEQVRSAANVDERSDIWSIGVILHELLAGEPPFRAETTAGLLASVAADAPVPIRRLRSDVPEEVERLILACLEKDPARRLPDVSTVLGRLRAAEQSLGEVTSNDRLALTADSVERAPRRRRVRAGAVALVAATTLVGAWIALSGGLNRAEGRASNASPSPAELALTSSPPAVSPAPRVAEPARPLLSEPTAGALEDPAPRLPVAAAVSVPQTKSKAARALRPAAVAPDTRGGAPVDRTPADIEESAVARRK